MSMELYVCDEIVSFTCNHLIRLAESTFLAGHDAVATTRSYPNPTGLDLLSGRTETRSSSDDVILHRPQGGGGPTRHPDLGVDVLDVVVGGPERDVEVVGDVSSREPSGREA